MNSKYKVGTSVGPLVKDVTGSITENNEDCVNTLSKFYSSVFTTENRDYIPFANLFK